MNELLWIVLASFVYIAIGMFWYSPAAFGKAWCKAKWFIHEDMKNKKMPKDSLVKAIIGAIIISIVFTFAAPLLDISTIEWYLRLAFITWILWAMNEFSKYIWEQEKLSLVILNSLYLLVAYVSVASIVFYI